MTDAFPTPAILRGTALLVVIAAFALHGWTHRHLGPRWILWSGSALGAGAAIGWFSDDEGRRLLDTHSPLDPFFGLLWYAAPALVLLAIILAAGLVERAGTWIGLANAAAFLVVLALILAVATRSREAPAWESGFDAGVIALAAIAWPPGVAALAARKMALPRVGAAVFGALLLLGGGTGRLLHAASPPGVPGQGERRWSVAVQPEGNAVWTLDMPFLVAPAKRAAVMDAWRAHLSVESGDAEAIFSGEGSIVHLTGRGPATVSADYHYYGSSADMERTTQFAYGAPNVLLGGANATVTWAVVLGAGIGGCGGVDGGALTLVADHAQALTSDGRRSPPAGPCV